MRITRLQVKNWRNFRDLDVEIDNRLFIMGANATGKSNLLDVFRFLQDIASPQGGLRVAIENRGGLGAIRNLNSRYFNNGRLEIRVEMEDEDATWTYNLAIGRERGGLIRPSVEKEEVTRAGKVLLARPNHDDKADSELLTQTHIEQIASNVEFRPVAQFLSRTRYFHPSPQNIRTSSSGNDIGDVGGDGLITEMNATRKRDLNSRLRRIQEALKIAVPEFESLDLEVDESGRPHLVAGFKHWRRQPAKQRETEFSDGTIRLIALLWAVLSHPKSGGILLLEEPEISLNREIIQRLPSMIARAQRGKSMQVMMTTHSPDLIDDEGIDPEEVLVLTVGEEYTEGRLLSQHPREAQLVSAGINKSEVVSNLINPSIPTEFNDLMA